MYEKHVEFILCLWENVASVAYLEGRLKSNKYGMQSAASFKFKFLFSALSYVHA